MRNVGQILGMLLLSFFCVAVVAAQAFSSSVVVATSSSSVLNSSSSSCHDDESIIIRGGDDRGGIDTETRDVILRFLDTSTKSESTTYSFHIQGWRWHFMSLSRDVKRLQRLANHLLSNVGGSGNDYDIDGLNALQEASNYVINFNMAGLYRIQSNMFLKFIREHLCDEDSIRKFIEDDDNDVVDETTEAFNRLVDVIDAYRIQSERIGGELVRVIIIIICNALYYLRYMTEYDS